VQTTNIGLANNFQWKKIIKFTVNIKSLFS